MDTYLQHHPYTYICFKMAESSPQHSIIVVVHLSITISTAAPTHHARYYTHTHLQKTIKKFFSKIFAPFSLPLGAIALHFRIPLLALRFPIFFPIFRPLFSLPSSRFPRPTTSWSSGYFTCLQTGVTNLWPNPKHGPYHFLSHPYTSTQALEPTLHRHPYTPTSNVTPT